MAASVAAGFGDFTSRENTQVLRRHLESTIYTCGSSSAPPGPVAGRKPGAGSGASSYRRGYVQRRPPGPKHK